MLGVLITIHELATLLLRRYLECMSLNLRLVDPNFPQEKGETYYSLRALPLGDMLRCSAKKMLYLMNL